MSKHLRAFRCGANVLAFNKNNQNYGMTCAWAMMIDYSKIAMLIGGQSITGQNLELGLNVGVSALAEGQQEIAKVFGILTLSFCYFFILYLVLTKNSPFEC